MIAIAVIVFCVVSGVFVFLEGRRSRRAFKKMMDDLPKLVDLAFALLEKEVWGSK